MRQILHVDMDAFYASVEERDDPTLAGKPLIVGGRSHRGVVAAASYAVRKFGVHSAMPMAQAMRLCPQAIVLPPRMDRYAEVSASVFAIFHRYTPLVEGLSLDEAFLDVTGSRSLFGDGAVIARRIKDEIHGELSLTASAGVARTKFCAKIASDFDKPDGLFVVPEDAAAFLAPLPIERMWGIGPKTAPKLRQHGFATLGDLAAAPPGALEALFGGFGRDVRALSRGEDARAVQPDLLAKSVGAEQTYERDLRDTRAIAPTLLDHASRVAERLFASGLRGRVVVVKLKYADFTLLTRRTTLSEPVMDTTSIYEASCALLATFPRRGLGVRLTGVSVSALEAEGPSLSLFDRDQAERRRRVEEVSSQVKGRFGSVGITRATLLEREAAFGVSNTVRRLPSKNERGG